MPSKNRTTGEDDWMLNAIQKNAEWRRQRYAEVKAEGVSYLVECQDLWDSDEYAGVYFEVCPDEAAVDSILAQFDGSTAYRVLGIYSVRHPLEHQGRGVNPEEWRHGKRVHQSDA